MRHTERALTAPTDINAVIRDCQVMRLAMSRGDRPYCVPLCFGYDGKAIFFHTGREGLKVDHLQANPRVCFEFERLVRPLPSPEAGCRWSMAYESVVGFGTVVEIVTVEEREYGLCQIMGHYSGRTTWTFSPGALEVTRVWRIGVESMTGRRSKHGWTEPGK